MTDYSSAFTTGLSRSLDASINGLNSNDVTSLMDTIAVVKRGNPLLQVAYKIEDTYWTAVSKSMERVYDKFSV